MTQAIVYFDGLCGLCDRFVQFVIRRDRGRRYRFAPLQGTTALERLAGRLEVEAMKTVVLEEDGGLRVRSDAALAILAGLGGAWRLGVLLRIIPRMLRDLVYDLIARHRHRWFGRLAVCRLPAPEELDRFLP